MKLYYSPTSPYARKVRAAAIQLGLDHLVEPVAVNPLDDPPELTERNPLGKVPLLEAADGTMLCDSLVICQYLFDVQGRSSEVLSIDLLNRHALANGLIDAALCTVMERRRDRATQSTYWLDRWSRSIARTTSRTDVPPDRRFDLGDLTLAIALEYLDFRLPDIDWRTGARDIDAWLAEVRDYPELVSTRPTHR